MSYPNAAIEQNARLWGRQSCSFSLPGFNVNFVGLTRSQKDKLTSEFGQFLIELPWLDKLDSTLSVLTCEAIRLEDRLDVPIEDLKQGDQYSPQITKEGDIVTILGHNFMASFGLEQKQNMCAQLAVAEEGELTQLPVVENFLRIYAAYNAVALSGAVLHSAGLVFDGQATLFVGYSNVGKTTLTRKAHAYGATVLSDDINLILPAKIGYCAYKVPFTGEFGRTLDHQNTSNSFPVKAMVLLEQGVDLAVEKVDLSYAISRLLAGSPFVNSDEHQITLLFSIYAKLAKTVPIIRLSLPIEASVDQINNAINEVIDK